MGGKGEGFLFHIFNQRTDLNETVYIVRQLFGIKQQTASFQISKKKNLKIQNHTQVRAQKRHEFLISTNRTPIWSFHLPASTVSPVFGAAWNAK